MYDVTCFLYIPLLRSNISCEDVLGMPMAVDEGGDGANSFYVRESFQSPTWQACFESKSTQQKHNKRIRAALLDGDGLRATIKDFAKARGQRPQNRGSSVRTSIACRHELLGSLV